MVFLSAGALAPNKEGRASLGGATPTAAPPVVSGRGLSAGANLETWVQQRTDNMDQVYKYLLHSGPSLRLKMYDNKLFSARAPICFVCNQPVRLDNAKTDETGMRFTKNVT